MLLSATTMLLMLPVADNDVFDCVLVGALKDTHFARTRVEMERASACA